MNSTRKIPATTGETYRTVFAAFEVELKRTSVLDVWEIIEEDRRIRTADTPRHLAGGELTSDERAAYAARAFRMGETKIGVEYLASALGLEANP